MKLLDINLEDLGLHGDKELADEVSIIKERKDSHIVTRVIKLDSVFYLYKYYEPEDNGLPVTGNYTILYEAKRDNSKVLGFKTIEDS